MASYNYIALMGNITRDITLSYTPNQVEVAEFGMAVNKKYKDKETVCFIDCVAFKNNAVNLNKYCKKGDPLFISGELQLDTWQDKEGGNRSKHKILVNSFQFLLSGEKKQDTQPETKTVDEDSEIPF